ncbi:V-set and immunoglobulin domain-containing protein 1-like [Hemiscyllium ocellatum]|uniref:V-set and immunoglobulin domain-containing protein 1-like n=1 Tax=Hemiscyllium ocellatum TaxID=170820 RepID=UPI0029664334|nr:V-set and immunoglobulin domain-containing protein 1-like [Hemiscyllium ocellatum]
MVSTGNDFVKMHRQAEEEQAGLSKTISKYRSQGCVFAVEVTVKDNHLNVTEGGNATLQCTYTTTVESLSELNIQWTFLGTTTKKPKQSAIQPAHFYQIQQTSCATGYNVDDSSVMLCPKTVHMFDRRGLCNWQHQIYFSEGKQIYINEEFKGRLVATHAPGNASITIEKLRPSDTGDYLCQVDNPPDFTGTNIRSIVLTVLVEALYFVIVPPSKPTCGIDPHPAKTDAAILNCHSNQGVPTPKYHWMEIVNNVHQNISGHSDPRTGILTISNVSQHEHGIYQCTAFNSLGNMTCTVDLSALLASENDHVIGAIIGAILAAIVIGAIVWVIAKKTKKRAKKNMEKDTEFQVKQEPRKTSTTYASVPTDHASAAATNATDAQLSEASEIHSHPNETPLLSENVVPSGTEKTPNEEIEGVGTHAV